MPKPLHPFPLYPLPLHLTFPLRFLVSSSLASYIGVLYSVPLWLSSGKCGRCVLTSPILIPFHYDPHLSSVVSDFSNPLGSRVRKSYPFASDVFLYVVQLMTDPLKLQLWILLSIWFRRVSVRLYSMRCCRRQTIWLWKVKITFLYLFKKMSGHPQGHAGLFQPYDT